MSDTYENLAELIEALEKIKACGHGIFSMPKAIHLLAKEIQEIKKEVYKNKTND